MLGRCLHQRPRRSLHYGVTSCANTFRQNDHRMTRVAAAARWYNNNNNSSAAKDEPVVEEDYTNMFQHQRPKVDTNEQQRIQYEQQQKKQEQRQYFLNKKGRGWSDPWEILEMMEAKTSYEDLPDWEKKYISRITNERLQVLETTKCTLNELAQLPLPRTNLAHPATSAHLYALTRRRFQQQRIADHVRELANPMKIQEIQKLKSWEEKQTAVDLLFEDIEANLKSRLHVLGKHPHFGTWVERALEQVLQELQPKHHHNNNNNNKEGTTNLSLQDNSMNDMTETTTNDPSMTALSHTDTDTSADHTRSSSKEATASEPPLATTTATTSHSNDNDDSRAVPIFLDCFRPDVDATEASAPTILHPLRSNPKRPTNGRMVEEWELSADRTTRRIMLRQSTRAIARELLKANKETTSRKGCHAKVLVTGRQGTGKTAALAAIVATARSSGNVVLYLPEGDNMSQNGYYIVPNLKRPGYYDLPILQSDVCGDLLTSHRKQLEEFTVPAELVEQYCTEPQLTRLQKKLLSPTDEEEPSTTTTTKQTTTITNYSLVTLLEYGVEHKASAPAMYQIAVSILMKQDSVDFLLVMDEFNCLFRQPGHYFHANHDYSGDQSIPHENITLFEPVMNAMGLKDTHLVQEMEEGYDDDTPPKITPNNQNTTDVIINTKSTTTSIDDAPSSTMAVETTVTTLPIIQLPTTIQRGGVVVATTESHSVTRKTTDALIRSAKQKKNKDGDNTAEIIAVIEIPRLSYLEVEHMLSNYEAIGIGKLRLDRGETVMNPQEVAYLRMVSGGEAQHLMNACMW